MTTTQLTLLNTSIITAYGTYRYEPLTLEEARRLVATYVAENKPVQSAIGHASTAELMASLLEYPVTANRMNFDQTVADAALVFKLCRRPVEGKVLSRKELEEIGYEFGLLTRTD